MRLPKEFSLSEIAAVTGGRVEGPPETTVKSVALNPLAAGEGDLALVFEPKLVKRISECRASAVVVPEGVRTELPRIVVSRPMLALQRMLRAVAPQRHVPPPGVHPSAVVDPTAELAEGVGIGPLVVVGPGTKIGRGSRLMAGCLVGASVSIGEDCLLHQGVMVADYVQIGSRVILQQGASIGADGYGYVTERPSNLELRMAGAKDLPQDSNPHLKIPQIGTVIIEDDVEVGSNTTIDRATMGATVIGAGTKIDNLVMIAHNCRLGKEVLFVGLSALAGSCTVGDRSVIAGCVGVKDHVNIGKDAVIEAKAGVMRDVADGEVVVGIPAYPAREYFTYLAHMRKGPQIHSELKSLQKKVAELEAALKERQPVG